MVDFVTGTKTIFNQTTAPTGWTKESTYDDHTLRVVSGSVSSGGTVAFTSCMTSTTVTGTVNGTTPGTTGSTTLSTAQLASHSHTYQWMPPRPVYTGFSSPAPTLTAAIPPSTPATTPITFSSTGGGLGHSHPLTTSLTFTGDALNFDVKYIDFIIASKD